MLLDETKGLALSRGLLFNNQVLHLIKPKSMYLGVSHFSQLCTCAHRFILLCIFRHMGNDPLTYVFLFFENPNCFVEPSL